MKLKIIVFFLLLAFSGFAFSEALNELSLKEANFQPVIAEGPEVLECSSFTFLKEAIAEQPGVFIIFSIHSLFFPVNQGSAKISVFLNDSSQPLIELMPQDFQNNWARVRIPINGLAEKNNFKLCAKTSNSITKVEVFDDSKIGYYKMPVFELEKTVSEKNPIVGRELEVTLKATNTGSEAAVAKVSYWNIELNIAQITKGDSEFEGTIQPGETVTMRYFLKPKYAVQMDLASAILEFKNVFGEKETIYSNRPTIWVKEPEFKINAFYSIGEQKTLIPGQSAKLMLTVRNEGIEDLENVLVSIESTEGLVVSEKSIPALSISAGSSKSFEITASSIEEGSFQLGCTIEYSDYKTVNSKCTPLTLDFEKPKQNTALIIAIALLAIGAVIYAYIYKPEKKKEAKA